jgi:hypothetical protein
MASGDAPRKLNGALRVWLVAVSAPLLRSEERGPGAGRDSELVVVPMRRCRTLLGGLVVGIRVESGNHAAAGCSTP